MGFVQNAQKNYFLTLTFTRNDEPASKPITAADGKKGAVAYHSPPG